MRLFWKRNKLKFVLFLHTNVCSLHVYCITIYHRHYIFNLFVDKKIIYTYAYILTLSRVKDYESTASLLLYNEIKLLSALFIFLRKILLSGCLINYVWIFYLREICFIHIFDKALKVSHGYILHFNMLLLIYVNSAVNIEVFKYCCYYIMINHNKMDVVSNLTIALFQVFFRNFFHLIMRVERVQRFRNIIILI